jgi:hypothetical protein
MGAYDQMRLARETPSWFLEGSRASRARMQDKKDKEKYGHYLQHCGVIDSA